MAVKQLIEQARRVPYKGITRLSAQLMNTLDKDIGLNELIRLDYVKPDQIAAKAGDSAALEKYIRDSKAAFLRDMKANKNNKGWVSRVTKVATEASYGRTSTIPDLEADIRRLEYFRQQGNPLLALKGDISATDKQVTEFGGIELPVPVTSEGGPLFGKGKKYIWASELSTMKGFHDRAKAVAEMEGMPARLIHANMADIAFKHPMFTMDAWLQANVLSDRIPLKALRELEEDVRKTWDSKSKTHPFADFKGFDDPEIYKKLESNPDLRKAILASSNKAQFSKGYGFTNDEDIAQAFREFGSEQWGLGDTGFSYGLHDPNSNVESYLDPTTLTDNQRANVNFVKDVFHKTYTGAIRGSFEDQFTQPIRFENMFKDVWQQPEVQVAKSYPTRFNNSVSVGGTKTPEGLEKLSRMYQRPDQAWLDHNANILRAAAGLQRGEIDPELLRSLGAFGGMATLGALGIAPQEAEGAVVKDVLKSLERVGSTYRRINRKEYDPATDQPFPMRSNVGFSTPKNEATARMMDDLRMQQGTYGESVFDVDMSDDGSKTYRMPEEYAFELNSAGIATPDIVEIDPEAGAEIFHNLISDAKKENKFGASVYVYPEEEYKTMRLFTTPDGKAGYALKDNGDIVSAFSTGEHKGVAPHLLLNAIENGGTRLDAFDTVLPDLYSMMGFREGGRLRWADDQAPNDWDKALFGDYNKGEPDVVFMGLDQSQPAAPTTYVGRNYVDEYGNAVDAQTDVINPEVNPYYKQEFAASFFDPSEIEYSSGMSNLDPSRGEIFSGDPQSRVTMAYLSPEQFLNGASEIWFGNPHSVEKLNNVLNVMSEGTKLSSIPHLSIGRWDNMSPYEWAVGGHEGRHRSKTFGDLGIENIPVDLRSYDVRWGSLLSPNKRDYISSHDMPWPTTIRRQNSLDEYQPFFIPDPRPDAGQQSVYRAPMFSSQESIQRELDAVEAGNRLYPKTTVTALRDMQESYNPVEGFASSDFIEPTQSEYEFTKKFFEDLMNYGGAGDEAGFIDPRLAATLGLGGLGVAASGESEAGAGKMAMDALSRWSRGRELGYNVDPNNPMDNRWYHVTPAAYMANRPIDTFNPYASNAETAPAAGFFTKNVPWAENMFGNIQDYETSLLAEEDALRRMGDNPATRQEFLQSEEAPFNPSPATYPVYLREKKIFDFENPDQVEQLIKRVKKNRDETSHFLVGTKSYEQEYRDLLGMGNWDTIEDPATIKAMKDLGYNGFTVREGGNKNIGMFNPEDIRSVNAAFDPAKTKSGDILGFADPMLLAGTAATSLTATGMMSQFGRPLFTDEQGNFVSEKSITEYVPELGGWANIPTVYDGQIVDPQTAVEIIKRNNGIDPVSGLPVDVYADKDIAIDSAAARSEMLDSDPFGNMNRMDTSVWEDIDAKFNRANPILWDALKNAYGAAEVEAMILSGFVGQILGGAGAAVAIAKHDPTTDEGIIELNRIMDSIAQGLTFIPRSERGQQKAQSVGEFMQSAEPYLAAGEHYASGIGPEAGLVWNALENAPIIGDIMYPASVAAAGAYDAWKNFWGDE